MGHRGGVSVQILWEADPGRETGIGEIYWEVKSARDKGEMKIKGGVRQRKSDTNLTSKNKGNKKQNWFRRASGRPNGNSRTNIAR